MRGPKLSVRGKIMGTIIAVSVMVLALGAWAAFDAVTSTGGRGGPVLQKHYERYKSNLQSLGTSDYAIARIIASDTGLAQALDGAEAAVVGEAVKRLMGGNGTAARGRCDRPAGQGRGPAWRWRLMRPTAELFSSAATTPLPRPRVIRGAGTEQPGPRLQPRVRPHASTGQ